MIGHIFRKDLRLLWPLALLVAAIQVTLEWAIYQMEFMNGSAVSGQLQRPLLIAWFVGLVGLSIFTVQEDSIPGVDQDWLVRPLPRTQLLLAKLAFIAAMLCVPMLVLNTLHAVALGFPWAGTLVLALYKAAFVFMTLLLPVAALASMGRTISELLVLLAIVLLTYVLSTALQAALVPGNRCPVCGTSEEWLQHVLQHLELLLGSVLILVCQYYRRLTRLSRWIAVIGVVVYVCVQVPWDRAFQLQRWMDGKQESPQVQLQLVSEGASATGQHPAAHVAPAPRATARELLSGHLAAALQQLQQVPPPAIVRLPVLARGLAPGEFLRADRADFSLSDSTGQVLYRGRNRSPESLALLPDPASGQIVQPLELPQSVYAQLQGRPLTLSIHYYLTRMSPLAAYRISADRGQLASRELGFCESRLSETAVMVRCRKTGNPPSCFLGTLYSVKGVNNPPFLRCVDDYRPYIPALANIAMLSGMDLLTHDPIGVARYPVDPTDPEDLFVHLQVFAITAHLERIAKVAAFVLPE